ncbi:MAG: hypothetical protein PHY43_01755 [Verrucomicrobiales bacterium]|nr:hypothetical protein [Verrucomicrobiales bacterium]
MKTKAGLWIDHQAAIIVELAEAGEQIRQIKSTVEKQRRRSKDSEPAQVSIAAGEVPPDDSREREYQGHLARYYDEIISYLQSSDEILIFGPGEAKGELKKRFAKDKSGSRIIALETTDKMTVPQIVAHVRQHFHHEAPRGRVTTTAVPRQSTKADYA